MTPRPSSAMPTTALPGPPRPSAKTPEGSGRMPETGTQIRALDQHDLIELPASGNLLTILVEIPPHDEGTPAHRHPGPVYGYMIEGEMIFELEGDPPARSA